MLVIKEIALTIFLGWEMIEDLRFQMVRMDILLVSGVLGIVLRIIERDLIGLSLMWSILPGLIILLIGKLAGHIIGEGDGWIVLTIGLYWDVFTVGRLCYWSLGLVAVWGIIQEGICKIKKKTCKKEYPFVPFVFLAHIFLILRCL